MLNGLKTDSRRKIICSFLSLILPVVIFMLAFHLGTSETKIPASLTMRRGDFDMGLFSGVTKDLELLKDFSFGKDLRELLMFHMDPFFIISIFIPYAAAVRVMYAGYLLRFSLAGFLMQRFIASRLKIRQPLPLIFGITYSLSSVLISTASYTCIMDLSVMLPLVIDSAIAFILDGRKISKGIIFSLLFSAALYVSGTLNLLCVLPFGVFLCFFVSQLLTRRFARGMLEFLKFQPFLVLSVLISAITLGNTLTSSAVAVTFEEPEFFEFRSSFFDFLLGFLDGKAMGTRPFSLTCSVTVVMLVLLIMFFFNSAIPLRIRITLLVGTILTELSFASEFLYRLSILFKTDLVSSEYIALARFCCLVALFVFACAVSLKNLRYAGKKAVGLSCASVIILTVISNNTKVQISPSFFSMYFTGLMAILTYCFLSPFCEENVKPYKDLALTILVLAELSLNLSFIFPISNFRVSYDSNSVIFDRKDSSSEIELPYEELDFFAGDKEEYILLYDYDDEYTDIVDLYNNIAIYAHGEPIFRSVFDAENIFTGGAAPMINGEDALAGGGKIVSYKNLILSDSEAEAQLLMFTDHEGRLGVIVENGDETTEYSFKGPFITELPHGILRDFNVMTVLADGSLFNPNDTYGFYTCPGYALEKFESKCIAYDGSIELEKIEGYNREVTVLTGRRYKESTDVKVNGHLVETREIAGKLAFDIDPSVNNSIVVDNGIDMIYIFTSVSILAFLCSIVLLLISKRGQKLENDKVS